MHILKHVQIIFEVYFIVFKEDLGGIVGGSSLKFNLNYLSNECTILLRE